MHLLTNRAKRLPRSATFAIVAILGFAMQVTAIVLLTSFADLHIAAATAAGVVLAILHNFVWHERWTWSDRDRSSNTVTRLLRFASLTGVVSLLGTVVLTTVYVSALKAPVFIGNLLAVWSTGFVNYILLDRVIFEEGK
jgi:putative flippase GtrA